MTRKPNTIKEVNLVVINPVGRAGSVLMQSLFDGHPRLVTLPYHGQIYHRIPERIEDIDAYFKVFLGDHPALFDSSKGFFGLIGVCVTQKFGAEGNQDIVLNVETFVRAVKQVLKECDVDHLNVARREFFSAIHFAYLMCLGIQDWREITHIVYHPHGNDEWDVLLDDFPDLFYIAMTRDPRQDWESWRKVVAFRANSTVEELSPLELLSTASSFSHDAFLLSKTAPRIKRNQFLAVDLNELHRLNSIAMHLIFRWLEIEFDNRVLSSTFGGLLWGGNAADRVAVNGLDPARSKYSWHQNLSEHEGVLLSTMLVGAIKWLGYENDWVLSHDRVSFTDYLNFPKYLLQWNRDHLENGHFARKTLTETWGSRGAMRKMHKEQSQLLQKPSPRSLAFLVTEQSKIPLMGSD